MRNKILVSLVMTGVLSVSIQAKELYVICEKWGKDGSLKCEKQLDFKGYDNNKEWLDMLYDDYDREKAKRNYKFKNAIRHGWRVAYENKDEIHLKKNVKTKRKHKKHK